MFRWIRRLALWLVLCCVLALLAAWGLLRASLPVLDGESAPALAGMVAPATVQRDALGVVTIDAASEADAMRALGFVHAQERFFEMDLARRNAAGELSELFGPAAIEVDRRQRTHRMRARVSGHLEAFAGERMPQLQAYADGVNAGLEALAVRPWPYLLLRQAPRRWEVADSALTGYAMYFDLQDAENRRELQLWRLRQHLPAALFDLLVHDGSQWDAALSGEPRGNAPLPGAGQVDLRTLPMPDGDTPGRLADKGTPGSNNWAVAGALTADGRAIVADDMHLGLRAPNIWFRVRLRYADARAPGGQVDVAGFSLPGLPAVIVGSNGHVAWGFTNSYIDTADWLHYPAPGQSGEPQRPAAAGERIFEETIRVAGAEPQILRVRETAWGPVMHEAPDGSALALRWVAHQPGAVSIAFADMARAANLDQALAIAGNAGIPAQNLVVADSAGRIGWQLTGMRPQRAVDCSAPAAPPSTARPGDPTHAASGAPALAPGHVGGPDACPWAIGSGAAPHIVDPPDHRLWTANARVLDGQALALAGDGGYDLGARASQIRDGLMARERFNEADLLAIQLDDRALFLQRWWQLLQDEASAAPDASGLKALSAAARRWEGHASIDAVSYPLVRAWRLAVHARIADGLTAPAQTALGDEFAMPHLPQLEGVVWPLLEQRPAHLLPRRYDSWSALLEDAALEVRDDQSTIEGSTWGERNTARICHPLAGALPGFLGKRLCMPADGLPGDGSMPRVQGPAFGASQRMVVSPGHEADGIVHMPGGQSGHPLSPFWGAGHADWVYGRPSPFLPGPARHTLVLLPAGTAH